MTKATTSVLNCTHVPKMKGLCTSGENKEHGKQNQK